MTRTQRWILVATVLASATVFLDSTIVNVALPRIGRDLPHSLVGVLEGQTYVYTGYLLSLSTLLILAGALTDAYGRRRMFMLGRPASGSRRAFAAWRRTSRSSSYFACSRAWPAHSWCPARLR